MDVVMTGMAAGRAGGFVGPQHFALGVGDGQNVFAIGGSNQNEPFSVGAQDGKAQRQGC